MSRLDEIEARYDGLLTPDGLLPGGLPQEVYDFLGFDVAELLRLAGASPATSREASGE